MNWKGGFFLIFGVGGMIVFLVSISGCILGWIGIEVVEVGMGVGCIGFLDIVILGGGFLCFVRWLRIFFLDMLSWVVIGGIWIRVEGSWLIFDFILDSNFFSWLVLSIF